MVCKESLDADRNIPFGEFDPDPEPAGDARPDDEDEEEEEEWSR